MIFIYYTLWLIEFPKLIKEECCIGKFFPLSIDIAIYGPLVLLVVGSAGITGFLVNKNR